MLYRGKLIAGCERIEIEKLCWEKEKRVIVVTSGSKYIDIDAYASCIAYRELLIALGQPAKAVSTAIINDSVPQIVKSLPLQFDKFVPTSNDRFIVLDLSDPKQFDKIVNHNSIIEVIDHHTGFEQFWEEQRQTKVQIEKIGSIATIIYEKFILEKKEGLLTGDLCKLLVCAIVDNTLNLKASITKDRDIKAFNELCAMGKIDTCWVQEYFESCEREILDDLENAVRNDTKIMDTEKLPKTFGQLTVFNYEKVLEKKNIINKCFSDCDDWHLNIISLKDGRSYLYTTSQTSKQKLEKLFKKSFINDVLTLEKFMLRKEIIAKALN